MVFSENELGGPQDCDSLASPLSAGLEAPIKLVTDSVLRYGIARVETWRVESTPSQRELCLARVDCRPIGEDGVEGRDGGAHPSRREI